MENKKFKKLKINKMSEFPVIGYQEQMEIKGGNPSWWTSLLSLLGLGGDDNSTNTTNQNHYGSGDNVGGTQVNLPFSGDLIINGTSVSADTLSNHGITVTGQDPICYNGQAYMIYGDSVSIIPN